MAKGNVVAGLSEEQYAEIELAVMESQRGRIFLKEFLARNRNADTKMLLDAISRLESALCLKAIEHEGGEEFTPALAEIASVVTATRTEIAAIRNDLIAGGGALTQGPEAFTAAAEQANSLSADLLTRVEQVENLAWKIRELGVESEICDKLDVCVEELMTLCWKQDVSGQRAAKALSVLQYVNDRTGGNLVSVGDDTATDDPVLDALSAPIDVPQEVNTDQDAYFAEDAELFGGDPAETPSVVSHPAAPGLAYVENRVEDQLSSDELIAETTVSEVTEGAAPAEAAEPAQAGEVAPQVDVENSISTAEEAPADNVAAISTSDLIEKPAEMIGPANMNGFNEMAASIDAKGPFSATTLAQMVTPPAAAPTEETASTPAAPAGDAMDPFKVELHNLAKKDGFTFNSAEKPSADAEATTDAEPKADADAETKAEDEDGNGHIVIIRTPSEPDADVDRLPEPVTQEKPDENAETPMVVISPPQATTA